MLIICINFQFKSFFVENFNALLKNTQLDRCLKHKTIWKQMTSPSAFESHLSVCATIQEALEIVHDLKDNNSVHINVLFTGSLHLVGGALGLLNNLNLKQLKKAKRIRS